MQDNRLKFCQQTIIKIDLEIGALIQDIQECQGPISLLEKLNIQIEKKMQEMKKHITEFERFLLEDDREKNKILDSKSLAQFKKQYLNIQLLLRKANVSCQLNIEARNKSDLLGDEEIRKRNIINKDNSLETSTNITENMRALSQMMADQVNRTKETNSTLLSSSQKISQTHEELHNVSSHLQNSKKLLTKYGRREFTDKILIFITLIFFFASVLYIIKKRLWAAN